MQITAAGAEDRFDYFCAQAKVAPVVVEKDGSPDVVLLDYEQFRQLRDAAVVDTPDVEGSGR